MVVSILYYLSTTSILNNSVKTCNYDFISWYICDCEVDIFLKALYTGSMRPIEQIKDSKQCWKNSQECHINDFQP